MINQATARPSGPAVPQAPGGGAAAGSDPAIAARVSEILLDIERGGEDALRRYARDLDGWDAAVVRAHARSRSTAPRRRSPRRCASTCSARASAPRRSPAPSARRSPTSRSRSRPASIAGHRLRAGGSVGAYLPAGRVPLLASPFMTVLVPKVAGVETVVACAPPRRGGGIHPVARLRHRALRAPTASSPSAACRRWRRWPSGSAGIEPVDMIVGAGNAYVAEAKRQLYGRVGIDLLAGPSEIAVIADETADPELVAADLLGQAEHGPTSPVALVTTSEELGRAVRAEVERQLEELATAEVAGAAWRDHGAIIVAPRPRDRGASVSDELAPEHLEVQTADDDWYHDAAAQLRLDLPRRARDGRVLGQGRDGYQPRAADRRTRRATPAGSRSRGSCKPLTYQRIEQRRGGHGDRGGRRRDLGDVEGPGGARRDGGQAARARLNAREGETRCTSARSWPLLLALALASAPAATTRRRRRRRRQAARPPRTLTIYSSLPLQGAARAQSEAAVNGAKLALEQAGGKAGKFPVKYESLDDSTAQAGGWEPNATSTNARKAAGDDSTIGYIGEFNSGATAVSLPILNEAGIAQVSPGNTAVGITSDDPGAEPGEPDKYYPTGKRTYARVLPKDTYQGAALVALAKEKGCASAYILNDKEVYGAGLAKNVELAGEEGRPGDQGQRRASTRTPPTTARSRSKHQGHRRAVLHLQRHHGQQRGPDLQGHRGRAARRAAARPRGRRRDRLLRSRGRRPARRRRQARADHDPGRRARGVPARGQGVPEGLHGEVRRGEPGPLRRLRLRVDEPAARRDQARGRRTATTARPWSSS